MTIKELYESIRYFFNNDSVILSRKIETVVMRQHLYSWDNEVTEEIFNVIKGA